MRNNNYEVSLRDAIGVPRGKEPNWMVHGVFMGKLVSMWDYEWTLLMELIEELRD
jgi:hypothetical protein